MAVNNGVRAKQMLEARELSHAKRGIGWDCYPVQPGVLAVLF